VNQSSEKYFYSFFFLAKKFEKDYLKFLEYPSHLFHCDFFPIRRKKMLSIIGWPMIFFG